jgi:ABC-type uncharacterized transport system ATPase subunit
LTFGVHYTGTINILHTPTGKTLFIDLIAGRIKSSKGKIKLKKKENIRHINLPEFDFKGELISYKDYYQIQFTIKSKSWKEYYPHKDKA